MTGGLRDTATPETPSSVISPARRRPTAGSPAKAGGLPPDSRSRESRAVAPDHHMADTSLTVKSGKGSIALLAAYFAFGTVFQVFPPLFGQLEAHFGIGHAGASLVMSLFLAPLVLIALPGGVLADCVGAAITGHAGFALLGAGAVTAALARSFSLLLAGRALSGTGGGLLFVASLKLVTEWFSQERRGFAIGVFVAGLPLGTGLAFNLLAPIGTHLGWRAAALAGTAAVLGAWGAFALATRGYAPLERTGPRRAAAAVRDGEMLRLAAVTVFGYMAIIGFTTWAPTTFVHYAHVSLGMASLIASLLLVIDIPFAPFWGFLSDRVGRRRPFILAAFAVYFLGSLAVPVAGQLSPSLAGPALLVVTGVMGVGCSMFFPAALAIPSSRVPAGSVGMAYGMLLTAQAVGMMLGPAFVGHVLDVASAPAGFLTVSGVTLLGFVATLWLRSP
jgi:MFS family permease